jgi:ABC-type amino acid transport substrate-binding protein
VPSVRRGLSATLAVVLIFAACGPSTTRTSPTPDPLAALRARGTLIVSIRMTGPPPPREPGDAAHSQKRAFEAALAGALAQRILGSGAKTEFRDTGRDRTGPVVSRDADIAMSPVLPGTTGVSYSQPYAKGGLVLVATGAVRIEDLAGKTVATTPGEVDAAEAAQMFFGQRSVQVKLQSFTGLKPAIDALASGEVAVVVGDRAGVAVLNRGRASPLITLTELAPRPFAVAVRADATVLLARVNDALAALSSSGELRKLADAASFPFEAP